MNYTIYWTKVLWWASFILSRLGCIVYIFSNSVLSISFRFPFFRSKMFMQDKIILKKKRIKFCCIFLLKSFWIIPCWFIVFTYLLYLGNSWYHKKKISNKIDKGLWYFYSSGPKQKKTLFLIEEDITFCFFLFFWSWEWSFHCIVYWCWLRDKLKFDV